MKKNVLVLSSNGFIGSTLASALSHRADINLIGLTSESCNLLDAMATHDAIRKLPDPLTIVFLSTFGRFPRDDHYVYLRNVAMVTNLIAATKHKTVENVIFTSSVCMYGRPPVKLPVTEDIRIQPTGHYGLSKFVSEQLLGFHFEQCPLTILRIPGTYGKSDKGKSVISNFYDKISKNQPVVLADGGTGVRDFLYVDDIVSVIEQCIDKPMPGVFNVASGESYSMLDLVYKIGSFLDIKPLIQNVSTDQPQFDLYFDLSKLKRAVPSFEPHIVLEGLKKLR